MTFRTRHPQAKRLVIWRPMLVVQGHLEHVSTVRWPYAVADDSITNIQ